MYVVCTHKLKYILKYTFYISGKPNKYKMTQAKEYL